MRTRASTTIAAPGPASTGLQSSSAISGWAGGERRDAQEQLLQCRDIGARSAAVAVQEREGLQRPHHLRRVAAGERRQPRLDVAEQLHRNASGGAGHDRPEVGVGRDADEHLDALGGHRLHHVAGRRVADGSDRRSDLARGLCGGAGPLTPRRTPPTSDL